MELAAERAQEGDEGEGLGRQGQGRQVGKWLSRDDHFDRDVEV